MLNQVNPTIAIVDSGIGGVSILKQLINKYNAGNYIYFADNLYMPYGNKTKKWLNNRIEYIIDMLKNKYNVDYIIIACNTASASIDKTKFKNIYSMEFNKKYKYLATNLTKQNIPELEIIADNTLAKQIDINIFNNDKLTNTIKTHIKKHNLNKLKNLVLGCTHYELVEDCFKKYCPKTKIIKNSSFVINKMNFNININELNIAIILSKNDNKYNQKIKQLLN